MQYRSRASKRRTIRDGLPFDETEASCRFGLSDGFLGGLRYAVS